MTLEEAAKIIGVIDFAYPDTRKGQSDEAFIAYVKMWHSFFADDDYHLVLTAVRTYIATRTNSYAPNVGQIRAQIAKMTQPECMSEAEAWSRVKQALRNGYYGYHEEFDKLPPILKRCVGSEMTLREWSQIDTETLDSVIGSNFVRSFRAISKTEAEYAMLPAGIKAELSKFSASNRLDTGT